MDGSAVLIIVTLLIAIVLYLVPSSILLTFLLHSVHVLILSREFILWSCFGFESALTLKEFPERPWLCKQTCSNDLFVYASVKIADA